MQLTLHSQVVDSVVIIRCQGRIISGNEVRILQEEVENHIKKRVVLHLGEVGFMDSAGLGALVRLYLGLRSVGGGLKLCQLSPFVLKALEVTNLHVVIPTYGSESEALAAFSARPEPLDKTSISSLRTVLCTDESAELLAYLNGVLTQAGYEVFVSRHLSHARTLVSAMKPSLVIYGPSAQAGKSSIEQVRENAGNSKILILPSDFSTADASQAGADLVQRVRALLTD